MSWESNVKHREYGLYIITTFQSDGNQTYCGDYFVMYKYIR